MQEGQSSAAQTVAHSQGIYQPPPAVQTLRNGNGKTWGASMPHTSVTATKAKPSLESVQPSLSRQPPRIVAGRTDTGSRDSGEPSTNLPRHNRQSHVMDTNPVADPARSGKPSQSAPAAAHAPACMLDIPMAIQPLLVTPQHSSEPVRQQPSRRSRSNAEPDDVIDLVSDSDEEDLAQSQPLKAKGPPQARPRKRQKSPNSGNRCGHAAKVQRPGNLQDGQHDSLAAPNPGPRLRVSRRLQQQRVAVSQQAMSIDSGTALDQLRLSAASLTSKVGI